MGIIYTPRRYNGTPASYVINPYKGGTALRPCDIIAKSETYLKSAHLPAGTYILIIEPYPLQYDNQLVKRLLELFHRYRLNAIVRTNNPHRTDFKYLHKNDIYAVTVSDHKRRESITLDFGNDIASVGPTTMAERVSRMFDAQASSGCKTMLIFGENASGGYIKGALTYIKADLFVIEGDGVYETDKTEIKAAAGDRWCVFVDDGQDITKECETRAMEARIKR